MKKQNRISGLELVAKHFVNELKAIFTDKGALLILIGAMLIYPIVYSIGYYRETMSDMPVGVVDLDHSEMSRKYISMIDASMELQVTCEPLSLMEAESVFMHYGIGGVVVIPKGFQSDLMSATSTNVAVYADASYFLKYRNTYMAVALVNSYFSGGISVVRYMAEGKSFEQAKIANDPLPVYRHVLYNPASGYASFIMPGLILIIIQQTLLIGIGVLGGSFSESKASPFLLPKEERKKEILPYLTGKSGAYILISLMNISYGVIMIQNWCAYPNKANIVEVLMLLFPFLIAVIFLGIGLATLFKHRESAIIFMVFLSPIALFMSGLSWPSSAMPQWLVGLSKLMPSTTVVPAYLRMRTMGVGIAGVKREILVLYGQAALYVGLTIVYFFTKGIIGTKKGALSRKKKNSKITLLFFAFFPFKRLMKASKVLP